MSDSTDEMVNIEAPAGSMPAFLARPEGSGPFPAVVVIMEAFGLNDEIRDVARRIAAEGYVALAPDFYYRELPDNLADYDDLPSAIQLMGRLFEHGGFVGDMGAALDFLGKAAGVDAERIGVVGFCMGGALTFQSACTLSERIVAAAPFYGGGIVNMLPQAENISCPLYLFFGGKDSFIPLDEVERIEAKLTELGKPFDLKVYPDADHGFFCEQRPAVYHPEAAKDAWQELTSFFRDHLA